MALELSAECPNEYPNQLSTVSCNCQLASVIWILKQLWIDVGKAEVEAKMGVETKKQVQKDLNRRKMMQTQKATGAEITESIQKS